MTELEVVIVSLTPDETARGGVFWERHPHHALANPAWEGGDVFIADGDAHIVANTYAVKEAVRRNRLTLLQPAEPQALDEADIRATNTARELAAGHGISLLDVVGSGKDGAIITADVQREIARRRDEKKPGEE